jgi:hypothetical protein
VTDPKYGKGEKFHIGTDGVVEITEVYAVREQNNKVVYTVKYLDKEGTPESTLTEQTLEEVN